MGSSSVNVSIVVYNSDDDSEIILMDYVNDECSSFVQTEQWIRISVPKSNIDYGPLGRPERSGTAFVCHVASHSHH